MQPSGYSWWYIDALSDDQKSAVTLIVFVGSVFSPYYKFQRRKALTNPENFCAFNIALYGPRSNRWAMTERRSVVRDPRALSIGPSNLCWDGNSLIANIHERGVPVPFNIEGRIKITCGPLINQAYVLEEEGRHVWWPITNAARVEVDFDHPSIRWSGHGYVDSNQGDGPIEEAFESWNWSRSIARDKNVIFYDVKPRRTPPYTLAIATSNDNQIESVVAPPQTALPNAPIWRMPRVTCADPAANVTVVRTLEDTPFYSRSLVSSQVNGKELLSVHESLSLNRFNQPIVQAMLPFRMPRSFS